MYSGGELLIEGCAFTNAAYAMFLERTAIRVLSRNSSFAATVSNVTNLVASPSYSWGGSLVSDGWDFDAPALEKGHQWQFQYAGEIDSDSDYARSGGAAQGWRFQSNSNCGLTAPLQLFYHVNAADTSSVDYTLYAQFQAGDPFAGDLDETELYFTVTELKGDGTIVTSEPGAVTWDYDDTSTWQTMTIAHAAAAAGTLRIDVYLKSPSGTVHLDVPNNATMGYANGAPLWNLTRTSDIPIYNLQLDDLSLTLEDVT